MNACQCIANHFPLLNGNDVCTGKGTATGTMKCFNGRSEIWLHTSDTATVGASGAGNTVTSNCAGIQINNDGRFNNNTAVTCAAGTFHGAACNTIQYNTLTLHNGSAALNTELGGDSQTAGTNVYAIGNVFDHNSYTCDHANTSFQWGSNSNCQGNSNVTGAFAHWQSACGNEPNGSNSGC
jgi:hypothetical protein